MPTALLHKDAEKYQLRELARRCQASKQALKISLFRTRDLAPGTARAKA
jgi:hypothetical protein